MLNAATAIANAEASAKAIVSGIDAAFLLVPRPPAARPNASAGELLMELARKGVSADDEAGASIRRIRGDAARKLKAARKPIDDAFDVALFLHAAAVHITRGDPLPPQNEAIPDALFMSVKALRIHHRAGIIDGETAAARLRDASSKALTELAAAKQNYLKFFSVAQIASLKGAALVYGASGKVGAAAAMRDKAEKAKVAHNKFYSEGRSRRPVADAATILRRAKTRIAR